MGIIDSTEWLTMNNWKSFEYLMGEKGGCGGCWCTVFRQSTASFNENKYDGNKAFMRNLVMSGQRTGIIGFHNDKPIAWLAVSPREDYIKIDNSRAFKRIDLKPVWSITCFFISREFRRLGVSSQMIRHMIDKTTEAGITELEAYPAIPYSEKAPPAFLWVGVLSAFLKNGFRLVQQNGKSRAMVRYSIGQM